MRATYSVWTEMPTRQSGGVRAVVGDALGLVRESGFQPAPLRCQPRPLPSDKGLLPSRKRLRIPCKQISRRHLAATAERRMSSSTAE